MKIYVKYFANELGDTVTPIEKIAKGDWIDLRAAEDVYLKEGESALIPLGIGMILPDGYEAHVVPRSSTFGKWGILQANHVGIIDNSYSGDEDEWKMSVYAVKDTFIPFDSRICQFRIVEKQPEFSIETVEHLNDKSRGGFGSTGSN